MVCCNVLDFQIDPWYKYLDIFGLVTVLATFSQNLGKFFPQSSGHPDQNRFRVCHGWSLRFDFILFWRDSTKFAKNDLRLIIAPRDIFIRYSNHLNIVSNFHWEVLLSLKNAFLYYGRNAAVHETEDKVLVYYLEDEVGHWKGCYLSFH